MKTNYSNLTSFEAATVFVAVVGLGLVGMEIYYTVPTQIQTAVGESATLFDMHEQIRIALDTTENTADILLGTTQEFYDQFAVAFAQTFSYPETVGVPTIHFATAVSNYSKSVAQDYVRNNSFAAEYAPQIIAAGFVETQTLSRETTILYPTVAGMTIMASEGKCEKPAEELKFRYSYEPPKVLSQLFELSSL